MSQENLRKQHQRDLEEKEQEVEDMRSNTQKKMRALEKQVKCYMQVKMVNTQVKHAKNTTSKIQVKQRNTCQQSSTGKTTQYR